MNKEDRKDLVERLKEAASDFEAMRQYSANDIDSDSEPHYSAQMEMAAATEAALEAAAEIDRLRRELEEARKALRQMRCPRPCNHQPEDLDAGDCIDAGECGCIDSQFRDALIAGALQRADARESLFPEMSTRIKAEREQARRKAFEEAAEIADAHDTGGYTRQDERLLALDTARDIAAALRQRAEEEGL
ncbi:hypothetical protein [Sinorhizobium meliloti]|uniref:hypothetical protein n=1 Tax=Rhizobium meliloti TaxID=382 RepID=UPI000B497D0D|nr:hypothetical protein [Sinorhizobium meliloti]ASP64432.1 hypothetical protein CDO29_07410 [Sinorhizobium meliloti]MQX00825.1 hypothetical protein [Sinorhizobium meliloti]RVG94032.1 hypothetical protein CN221_16520 [Sinorhizobium meliloti]RVH56203.1 hypothetical protein CN209_32210 [Sinorhizobium meliloti]RVK42059.1 hypothetical protein CN160_31970 [Sinorhizobium meliloti]